MTKKQKKMLIRIIIAAVTADRTEFYTGKGNFADDSFPDPIPWLSVMIF